jgi:LacI family transcriptional regulator
MDSARTRVEIQSKKKSGHPILSEVDRKAGVGNTTVPRIINGGHRVNSKTLARMQRVIENPGVHTKHAARKGAHQN